MFFEDGGRIFHRNVHNFSHTGRCQFSI